MNNPDFDIFVGTQIGNPIGRKNLNDSELECALRWDVYLVLRWDVHESVREVHVLRWDGHGGVRKVHVLRWGGHESV